PLPLHDALPIYARGDGAFPDVPVQTGDDAEQDSDRTVREITATCGPTGVLFAEERRPTVDRPRLLHQRPAGGDLRAEVVLQAAVAHCRYSVPEGPRPSRPAAARLRHPCVGALRRRR